MSVDAHVRPAEIGDVGTCESIDAVARRDLIEQRGGEVWLAEHPELTKVAAWVTNSFVAEIDGAIVGFLVGRIDERSHGRVFVVDRVYVVSEARELGCGDELLGNALDHARASACDFLEAVALPGDRDTKNLYERAGITARSITVSTRLSGPSS